MPQIAVPSSILRRLIAATAPFAVPPRDWSRPTLNGIHIETRAGRLSAEASDGFRLGIVETPEYTGDALSFVAPMTDLKRLGRELPRPKRPTKANLVPLDPVVTLALAGSDEEVHVASEGFERVVPLIERVRYPELHKLLPREWRVRVEVDRSALLAAVRVAGEAAQENNHVAVLAFAEGGEDGGTITVGASQAGGELLAKTALAARIRMKRVPATERNNGLPTDRIALNADYLADAVRAVEGERIVVECEDANRAVVFRPATVVSGIEARYVIMPMHPVG